jgi:hypothetical protein
MFSLVFIRAFKTAACYKITYHGLNLHITQLFASKINELSVGCVIPIFSGQVLANQKTRSVYNV